GRAQAFLDEMNGHAQKHIAALEAHVSSRSAIALDGSPWLGHMLAVREDLRGVDAVEAYAERIAFDRAREDHHAASRPLYEAWFGEGVSERAKFEAVAAALPACFLAEGLPELAAEMESLHGRAEALELSEAALENYELVELHARSLEAGAAAYE